MYTRRAIDERRQLRALISDARKLARSIEDGGWFSSGLPGLGALISAEEFGRDFPAARWLRFVIRFIRPPA
jgi:hypothetical protein